MERQNTDYARTSDESKQQPITEGESSLASVFNLDVEDTIMDLKKMVESKFRKDGALYNAERGIHSVNIDTD